MATAYGSGCGIETTGTSGAGAERDMTIRGATCGGAEREPGQGALVMSKRMEFGWQPHDKLYCGIARDSIS